MKYRPTDAYEEVPLSSRSTTLWFGLTLWALFIPVILFVDRQIAFEILNSMIFAVSGGVCAGYIFIAWNAAKKPISQMESGEALAIGVVVGWLATALVFGVLFLWRLAEKDSSLIDSGIALFSRYMLLTAGFLHISAAGSINGIVPLRAHLRSGILTAVGLAMGCAVLYFSTPGITRL
jgi:hypothetical protein